MTIYQIKESALKLDACGKLRRVRTIRDAVDLLFTPQGEEFCEKNNFPAIDVFRSHKEETLSQGVVVDAGDIDLPQRKNYCIVGDTHATIHAEGVEYTHKIILMHGASATIVASNYAVVHVVNTSGGEVNIYNDNTAIIL